MGLPKIYYINLEHRTDRNEHFLGEMQKPGYPLDRIVRVDAVQMPENPALGCTRSHVKALGMALEDKECLPFIIAEDDLELTNAETFAENVKYMLDFSRSWNACMLAYCATAVRKDIADAKVQKLEWGYTTAAYMVHPEYAEKLHGSFVMCDTQQSAGKRIFADTHWFPLQRSDEWFAFTPCIARQMASYSDIEKKFVVYKH